MLEWREVYLVFGLFLLVIITPLIFLLIIDKPEDIGQKVDGGLKVIKSEYSENSGIDWQIKDLLKNRNFWILTAVFSFSFHR